MIGNGNIRRYSLLIKSVSSSVVNESIIFYLCNLW